MPANKNVTAVENTAGTEYVCWVLTWSIWWEPQLLADITMVSDVGERWLPVTAPDNIAPKSGYIIGTLSIGINVFPEVNDASIWIDIGIIIAIDPQADPIATDVNDVIKKNNKGKSFMLTYLIKTDAK